jgi:hypothetical protein
MVFKKITGAFPYIATLVALDLVIFFVIYLLHSLMFKDFPVLDSIAKGGYATLWRLISLQIIIQIVLMFTLSFFDWHKDLLKLLLAVIGSLVIAISIVYSPSLISKLVTLPNGEEIGEGFALVFSITMAWSFIRFSKVFK